MISLTNGHRFQYMVASGALGFDGKGWAWDRPLIAAGLMKLELFTVVLRTLTHVPRLYPVSNHSWSRPWTWFPGSPWACAQAIPGNGTVNKVGLWNPGLGWWLDEVAPYLDYGKVPLIVSLSGTPDELAVMAQLVTRKAIWIIGIEVNVGCPNSGPIPAADVVINGVRKVCAYTTLPVIVKVSVAQDYHAIARGVERFAQAISINSVPWPLAFGDAPSPMECVGKDKGKGGVSGKPAQAKNWKAVKDLAAQGALPVIAPSIMEYKDLAYVKNLGADAVSFGSIHLPDHPVLLKPWTIFTNPCKPTRFVLKEMKEKGQL